MAEDYPIIPPGGGGGAPLGPGAMVANTLQSILAGRRQDERQTMIDQLNKSHIEQEMETARDQAATNKTYREGLIADRKFKEDQATSEKNRLANVSGYYWNQWDDDPVIQRANEAAAQNPKDADRLEGIILQRRLMLEAQKDKSKPLVPAHVLHYGKSVAEPVMVPGAPPLAGNQPLMVPQGDPRELIHEAQPSQPSAAALPQMKDFQVDNLGPDGKPNGTFHIETYNLKPGELPSPTNRIKVGVATSLVNPNNVNKPVDSFDKAALRKYQDALKGTGANSKADRLSTRQAFLNSIKDQAVRTNIQQILSDWAALRAAGTNNWDSMLKTGYLSGEPDELNNTKSILDLIPENDRE